MDRAGRRYVLAASVALVAMVARIGWLLRPGAGQPPSIGFIVCAAVVGAAAAAACLAGVPATVAFLVAELTRPFKKGPRHAAP